MIAPESHVMFDIPKTMNGAARNTKFPTVTIHENVCLLKEKYREFFSICEERGLDIIVAVGCDFDRVPLKDWMAKPKDSG